MQFAICDLGLICTSRSAKGQQQPHLDMVVLSRLVMIDTRPVHFEREREMGERAKVQFGGLKDEGEDS